MKRTLALFFTLICGSVSGFAQDTVTVADGPALLAAIASDTVSGPAGFPAKRVYRLLRGHSYLLSGAIRTNNWPLRLVGDPPVSASDTTRPPFLQAKNLPGGPDDLINANGDVVLKNLWVTSLTEGGENQAENITMHKIGSSLRFDSCLFDYSSGSSVIFQGGHFSSFRMSNTIFRNQVNPHDWFKGRVCTFDSSSVDTVWAENCTFVNLGMLLQEQNFGNSLFVFNHNTVVNVAKFPFFNDQWITAYVINNIFYNCHFAGERLKEDAQGEDPDGSLYGALMNIDTLRAPNQDKENSRVIYLANNAIYRRPEFQAFYDSYNATVPGSGAARDSNIIQGEPFVNARTKSLFSLHRYWILRNNHDSTDPGFTQIPNNLDSMLAFLHARYNVMGVPVNFGWDGGVPGPTYQQETFPFPIPERLAYSNVAVGVSASRGYRLGDLNWYPIQMAGWLGSHQTADDIDWLTSDIKLRDGAFPIQCSLEQNYPNPFNPSTAISFAVPQAEMIDLTVFNLLGQKIRTLLYEVVSAGRHEVRWDGKNESGVTVGSGAYFYRLSSGSGFVDTRTMILMR